MSKKVYGKEGSDNVFKDLGFPNPELEVIPLVAVSNECILGHSLIP